MPRRRTKSKSAELLEYQQLKTAAGGSGASGGGDGRVSSLMGLLVRQRQVNAPVCEKTDELREHPEAVPDLEKLECDSSDSLLFQLHNCLP